MRSKIEHTTLQDTLNQAVVMIVNGTARAWSIQYERRVISTTSIKNEMEMQAEAERRKREEILQSEKDHQDNINSARRKATRWQKVLNKIHQFKIPAHKRSTIMSPTVSELRTSQRPRKPKRRKTSADPKLRWWMSWTHSSTRFQPLRRRWPRTFHSCRRKSIQGTRTASW